MKKEPVPYVPDKSDERFLQVVKEFGLIKTFPDELSYKELTRIFGNTNYNTLKKWRYRLSQVPQGLPFDNKRVQFVHESLVKLAKNILQYNEEAVRPMYDDETYDNKMNSSVKDYLQPVVSKPKEYDYEYQLTDEDLKNFVPFPDEDE